MEEQYKDARRLVESEVLYCQTYLVEHLIKEGDIDFWEIMRNGQQATPEVFEWWLVTESFANILADEGEVIVNKYNCHWWGRTTTGQAIYMDGVIEDIVATYYHGPNDNPTRPGARG